MQPKQKISLDKELPAKKEFDPQYRRAPVRELRLDQQDIKLALKNALRYIPEENHKELIPEFLDELKTYGRIYGYRFRPDGHIKGKPIDAYTGNCIEGRAFQVMIENNLDFEVALYPYELVTYGETGQVCQNWMQYRLIKRYLEKLTREQTLVMASGHPLGLFSSGPEAPRVTRTGAARGVVVESHPQATIIRVQREAVDSDVLTLLHEEIARSPRALRSPGEGRPVRAVPRAPVPSHRPRAGRD